MSMKKMLSVLLAGAMAISLAACGSKTPNPPEVTPKTPSGSSSVSTPEGPTDDGVWRPFNEKGETIRTDRDATGENGMVASSNVYATMAGLEILEQGGNAVDAAIAVCYALGVAEPFTSGLGGGGFMIVHTADGENQFIDYREVASSGQTAESWLDDSGNLIENANSVGGLAVGVPGEVAGLELRKWSWPCPSSAPAS